MSGWGRYRVSNKRRQSVLNNWGVGIFYSRGGYMPGYPIPGKERHRGKYRSGQTRSAFHAGISRG